MISSSIEGLLVLRRKPEFALMFCFAAFLPHAVVGISIDGGSSMTSGWQLTAIWQGVALVAYEVSRRAISVLLFKCWLGVGHKLGKSKNVKAFLVGAFIGIGAVAILAYLYGYRELETPAFVSALAMVLLALGIRPQRGRKQSENGEKVSRTTLRREANSMATSLMVGPGVVLLFLSYWVVLNVSSSSGGLKARCAKLAVVAAELTPGIRELLVGDSSSKTRAPSLPVMVYSNVGSDYFLWAPHARRTFTLPKSLVRETVTCDDTDLENIRSKEPLRNKLSRQAIVDERIDRLV